MKPQKRAIYGALLTAIFASSQLSYAVLDKDAKDPNAESSSGSSSNTSTSDNDSGYNANSLDSSKLKADPSLASKDAIATTDPSTGKTIADCDNVCGLLIKSDHLESSDSKWDIKSGLNSRKDPQRSEYASGLIGVGDQGGWATADDTWCGAHGSATVSYTENKAVATVDRDCNVPVSAEDRAMFGGDSTSASRLEVCKQVNKNLLHCKLRNSQVESQCLAYVSAKDGLNVQYPVLALDAAATVTCTVACAMVNSPAVIVGAAQAATHACTGVSAAAGVTEIVGTVTLKNSTASKAVSGIFTGIGLGSAVTSEVLMVAKKPAEEAGQKAMEKAKKAMPCITMASFAILTGVRTANIVLADKSKKDSCDNIQQYISDATPTDPNAPKDIFANYKPSNGSGGSSSGKGGSTGGSGSYSSGSNSTACSDATCYSSITSQGAAAVDAGILSRSGMEKTLAPLAQKIQSDLASKVHQGAGAVLAAAIPASAGSLGAAISKLAEEAQKNPNNLGLEGLAKVNTQAYSSSGRSVASADKSGSDPFASLLGGGAKDPMPSALNSMSFESHESTDIWHAGTSDNLFQIVSGRFGKVAPRLNQ